MDSKPLSASFLDKPSGTSLLILLVLLSLSLGIALPLLAGNFPSVTASLLSPFFLATVISGGAGFWVVPLLRQLKAAQVIQEDGPQSHLKKAGTPTMGGIFFMPVAILVAILWSQFNVNVVAVSLVTLAYFGIGWIDDWQILKQQSNKGLTPRQKLILQIGVAIAFCVWMFFTQPPTITEVQLPGFVLPLGLLFWVLAGFTLVAESNATNLTDGVDGLAAGTSALAFLGLAALVAPSSPELMIFCAALSGGCVGFVVHNRNPAKVFMGDTGSLPLGGALGAVGLLSGNLWGLLLVSGIFLAESLSVIAQVSYYKATKGPDGKGKRLLKMAPIHHHLELSGWAETKIVGVFYLINAVLAVLAVLTS